MKFDLPKSIIQIIETLKADNQMNNQKLLRIAELAKFDETEITSYSDYNHLPQYSYGRREVYKTDSFGIYVMSWCTGDFTAIHNHGHSDWGAVCFLGNAEHRLYNANNNELKLISSDIIKKGSVKTVCSNFVHAMGNLYSEPFMTLHIYGSNSYTGDVTEDSKIYELNNNRIRITKGPAYINISDKLCKRDMTGIITNEETRNDFDKFTKPFLERNRP